MRRSNAHGTWRKEVFTRGVIGWQEPVFFGGECIGYVPKKSDRCLELYLKAHDPAYRDRQSVELSGPQGAPIRTQTEIQAQLAPYEPAVALLVDSLIALRELEAPSASAPTLPGPAGPEVIDVEAVPSPRPPPRSASPALGATSRGRTPTAPSVTVSECCRQV